MPHKMRHTVRHIMMILTASAAILGAVANPATAGAFSEFYGTWSGGGNAIFNGGTREKLLCKGYYTGKQPQLKLALRCASRGQKIDMRAVLTGNGANVTGTWEERTFNASGAVSGTLKDKKLKVKLEGGLSGTLTVSLGNKTQMVSLDTEGSTLSGVKLKLERR